MNLYETDYDKWLVTIEKWYGLSQEEQIKSTPPEDLDKTGLSKRRAIANEVRKNDRGCVFVTNATIITFRD